MDPSSSYRASMLLIRARLVEAAGSAPNEHPVLRAERIALHVRKIIEGVAFAALSAAEERNCVKLPQWRTKDADDLLNLLQRRSMLRLPTAQHVQAGTTGAYAIEISGHPSADVSLDALKAMYSRASSLIHERHPEAATLAKAQEQRDAIETDSMTLRHWLWNHCMFFGGRGFLVQMGLPGSDSFMVLLTKAEPV